MNKALALIISLCAITITSDTISMQAPEVANIKNVTFDKPHIFEENTLEINALLNKEKVGHIHYEDMGSGVWYIQELLVNPEHRNADKKIGFSLFEHIMQKICATKPKKIYWFVSCITDDSPPLDLLINIYQRIVSNLGFDQYLIADTYSTTAYMEIKFIKEKLK